MVKQNSLPYIGLEILFPTSQYSTIGRCPEPAESRPRTFFFCFSTMDFRRVPKRDCKKRHIHSSVCPYEGIQLHRKNFSVKFYVLNVCYNLSAHPDFGKSRKKIKKKNHYV